MDELAIQGDCLNTLEVERNAFRFGEGHGLPKFFKMVDNVKREMIIKIWIGNTLHCSYAYLGQYYHLHSSFEAAVNDYVSKCSYYACEEAYNAVAKQLGLPMPRPVKEWQGIWTYYRNPSLQDTVLRIGADPIRKLSRNERFIGPGSHEPGKRGRTGVYLPERGLRLRVHQPGGPQCLAVSRK